MTVADVRPGITEEAFQASVIDAASLFKWRHYHTRDSRRSVCGFPDLVLIRPPELLVVELKKDGKSKVRDDQLEWLKAFEACRVETHVWTPAHWDAIVRRLSRRQGPT